MILYNVTVNIDYQAEEEWLKWMQEEHIPEVLATGYFEGNTLYRLLNEQEDNGGTTYSVQYFAKSMDELESYLDKEAAALQKKHADKFKNKFVAFRTFLEKV
ncbi:MAG: DUF4286 family protein [Cyclobacteriaceae bacterium]|nr:DUF4286 family protein [Cyclobacteriaceae bacterium]MCH8515430.1 DUF4286 family protein [Cyclobacteriaceae bacterium]